MTPSKEDYLKVMMELSEVHEKVTNKLIAETLQISPPGVTDMMNKLVKEGFVLKERSRGFRLSKEGQLVASALIRKHRILEVFLVEKLAYSLSEVHQDAEVLEHACSDQFIDKLEAFLNFPTQCPHGGAIPDRDGLYRKEELHPLSEVKEGKQVRIHRFLDDPDILMAVEVQQISLGEIYRVVENIPLKNRLTIKRGDHVITLSAQAADNIFVDRLEH